LHPVPAGTTITWSAQGGVGTTVREWGLKMTGTGEWGTERGDDERQRSNGGVLASWGAVLRDMYSLAADLTTAGNEMVRQVPSVPSLDALTGGWTRVEEAVLREVKLRLDRLEGTQSRHQAGAGAASPHSRPTPAQLLDDLLGASIDADSAGSREELYRSLLLRLVPDEARILAALAEGTDYPLIHVQTRTNGNRIVLSNASTVGRAAGVQVPDAVGTYVAHLRTLGLAQEGPADDSLSVQYDILLGEPAVRNAEEEARAGSRFGAKVVRRTLRISPLGMQLWKACRPFDVLDEPEPEPGVEERPSPDATPPDTDSGPQRLTPGPGPGFNPDTVYVPEPHPGRNGIGGRS
jgi:hypothetical protein